MAWDMDKRDLGGAVPIPELKERSTRSKTGYPIKLCSRGRDGGGTVDGRGKGRGLMAEPAKRRTMHEDPREESVEEILAAARPLPLGGEMIIEDLTDEEEQAFYDAIDNL